MLIGFIRISGQRTGKEFDGSAGGRLGHGEIEEHAIKLIYFFYGN
jgi:hypothetical protein